MRLSIVATAALLAAAPVLAYDTHGPYPQLAQAQPRKPAQQPDVIYVPTPHEVVDDILRIANVKKGDVLYDLGSGDGHIAIAAAKIRRARGRYRHRPRSHPRSDRERARRGDEAGPVPQEDLFKADFREATVVTLAFSRIST